MIIEQTTDLGQDALAHPQKYNGFMGISIFHKFFAKKRMRYYFEWSAKQFKECIILLMDDPDKYNCMVFKELDEQEALKKARIVSDEIKTGYEKVLKQLNLKNVKIIQFRDFNNEPLYQNILSSIETYVEQNSLFKEDLTNLMEMGIGEKIKDFITQKEFIENRISGVKSLLFHYIVEELASIIYFTELNYPIEIDPTKEFSTKKLLYEGSFPDLYKQLKLHTRGHIYIHPPGIIKSSY